MRLGDFGVSGELTGGMTSRSTLIGTPYYIAPEIVQEDDRGYKEGWLQVLTRRRGYLVPGHHSHGAGRRVFLSKERNHLVTLVRVEWGGLRLLSAGLSWAWLFAPLLLIETNAPPPQPT